MEEEIRGRKMVFRFAVPVGAVLLVFHLFAVVNNLYRLVPSIDIIAHFGATVVGGIIVYWLIVRYPNHIDLSKSMFFTLLIGLSLGALGGVIWEFIEFFYDKLTLYLNPDAMPVQLGLADTMKDLLFNTIGGLTVAIFVWLRYYKHK